jgi:hypothetical protein
MNQNKRFKVTTSNSQSGSNLHLLHGSSLSSSYGLQRFVSLGNDINIKIINYLEFQEVLPNFLTINHYFHMLCYSSNLWISRQNYSLIATQMQPWRILDKMYNAQVLSFIKELFVHLDSEHDFLNLVMMKRLEKFIKRSNSMIRIVKLWMKSNKSLLNDNPFNIRINFDWSQFVNLQSFILDGFTRIETLPSNVSSPMLKELLMSNFSLADHDQITSTISLPSNIEYLKLSSCFSDMASTVKGFQIHHDDESFLLPHSCGEFADLRNIEIDIRHIRWLSTIYCPNLITIKVLLNDEYCKIKGNHFYHNELMNYQHVMTTWPKLAHFNMVIISEMTHASIIVTVYECLAIIRVVLQHLELIGIINEREPISKGNNYEAEMHYIWRTLHVLLFNSADDNLLRQKLVILVKAMYQKISSYCMKIDQLENTWKIRYTNPSDPNDMKLIYSTMFDHHDNNQDNLSSSSSFSCWPQTFITKSANGVAKSYNLEMSLPIMENNHINNNPSDEKSPTSFLRRFEDPSVFYPFYISTLAKQGYNIIHDMRTHHSFHLPDSLYCPYSIIKKK